MKTNQPHATVRSSGDFDYDSQGQNYAQHRRTDPRIATIVHQALGAAHTVLNIGAGTGSYEPEDRHVLAIEPSTVMRAQRPKNAVPAVNGVAENIPLDDQSVDAAMALVTVHQWRDLAKGLSELCRVTRGRILVLTFDSDAMKRYWLADYVPELMAHECRRIPAVDRICQLLGGKTEVQSIPIPKDCIDGFNEAFYARPEQFLEPSVRRCQSAWRFVPGEVEQRFVKALADDLKTGVWDERYGSWRQQPHYDGSLRLIVRHGEAGRNPVF